MLVGVAHELVAGVNDLLAEIGVLLDVLAEVEEGRLAAVLLEDAEVLLGIGIGGAVIERERDELFALVVGLDLVNRHDAVLGLLQNIAVSGLSRGLAVADLVLADLRPLADIGDVSPGVAAHLELRLLLDDVDVVLLVPVCAVADGDVVAVSGTVRPCVVGVYVLAVHGSGELVALPLLEHVAADAYKVAGLRGEPF